MNLIYLSITGLLVLAGAGTSARAQSAVASLQKVQTIALDAHTSLGGTVQLANRNTVLLLTDTETPTVRMRCLAPDGHTVWETKLDRYQHPQPEKVIYIGEGREAKQARQEQEQRILASLWPMSVLTDGNDIVIAERLTGEALKKLKNNSLRDGQVLVQRLDEQGYMTKVLFEPHPEAASRKVETRTLGRYAEAGGYAEVVRETNKHEQSMTFRITHYDLKTKQVRQEPLALPALSDNAAKAHDSRLYKQWYQEWAYLGHRSNQTYFCRRTLLSSPTNKNSDQMLGYQVYITDDHGAATGGFNTTLELNKGTSPHYAGPIFSYGELNHVPNYFETMVGKDRYATFDEWDTSTGGMGSFYLDHSTGDVFIFGEYGSGNLPESKSEPTLLGYFQRRYSADGKTLSQLQMPYGEAMRAKGDKASFKGHYYRLVSFYQDPLSGQSGYGLSTPRPYGNGDRFDLILNRNLELQRYDYRSGRDQDKRILTDVRFVDPFWVHKFDGHAANQRSYEHAAPTDLPVYAALEKLSAAAGQQPCHEFHLSVTGSGTGLVVERRQTTGGQLQVYTF
jgi:hypothetical protein